MYIAGEELADIEAVISFSAFSIAATSASFTGVVPRDAAHPVRQRAIMMIFRKSMAFLNIRFIYLKRRRDLY